MGNGHAAVGIEATHRQLRMPFTQRRHDEPLLGVALAAVIDQLDEANPGREGRDQAAGLDGRELLRITDEDHFGVRTPDLGGEVRQESGPKHPGFVDHEHVANPEMSPPCVEPAAQRVSGRRSNSRTGLQLPRGAGREARTDHPMTGRLERLPDGVQRERLAGTGAADDHVDGST